MRTFMLAATAALLACANAHAGEVGLPVPLADLLIHCKAAADVNDLPNAQLYCIEANGLRVTAEAHVNLGSALYMHSRYKEAEFHFIESVNMNPKLAVAHFDLGRAYEVLGKKEEALEQYREAQNLGDSDAAAAIKQLFPATAETKP